MISAERFKVKIVRGVRQALACRIYDKLKFIGQSHRVLMNLFQRAQGQRKRATSVVARNNGSRTFGSGLQERFDFRAQWLYLFHFQHSSVYARPRTSV